MSDDTLERKPGAAGGGSPSSSPVHTITRIVFPDGYSVSADFLAAVKAQIADALPHLDPGYAYTTKQLCGQAFWSELSAGEQRNAGRCLAYLVADCMLPLVHVPGKNQYPRRYRLKSD